MREEVIRMDYPGAIISVNHYLGKRKGGGQYVKPETKIWKDEIGWMIKHLHIEDWQLPLSITCDGFFKDERSAPDLSNLAKVVCDAIAEVADGVNDKDFRWHDGKREIIGIKETPHLLITIRESEAEPPLERTKPKSRAKKGKSKREGLV